MWLWLHAGGTLYRILVRCRVNVSVNAESLSRCVMAATSVDDDPLAADDTSPYASLVVSALVASTPVLTMLFTLFACGFVIRHNRRLPQLCSMRVVLSLAILLWVCSTLASDVAFWHTIGAIGAWQSSDSSSRELVCKVQVVVRYGVAEPLTLLLILSVFHRKSTVGIATPLHPWRLIRIAASVTLLFALVHAGLIALLEAGAMPPEVIGPRPATTANYSSSWPLAASPPSAAPSEAADQSFSWWRAEGCAGTYGTFIISTIFVAIYEVPWAHPHPSPHPHPALALILPLTLALTHILTNEP